jgi:hypothetical protein
MIIDELFEGPQMCPECGGISFSDLILAEKKDACYYKVKASAKVWPSAYASGRLVQCRKKGAANYGNKSEGVAEGSRDRRDPYDRGYHDGQRMGSNSYHNPYSREDEPTEWDEYKSGFNMAQIELQNDLEDNNFSEGVAEGSSDTVYPNAEVIKSKNGKPVGEIYQDGNSWGCFHYKADRGYDFIDSREEAIEALKDLHQETGRSRPDYTVKGVAEGSEPQVGDAVYYGKRLVGWFKGYSEHGKIITEPNYEEMGDEYANRDVYWDPQDKITIKPEQGVAEGSEQPVSFREMVNVVDQHYPKYYAELSGSDISDKQFERAIVNAYKKIMQKQGMAETRRGQIPMTLQPGETDNIEPENISGFRTLPAYKQGQAAQQKAGKQLIQKSPFTFQSDQDWAYRQGAFDTQQAAMFANFGGTKPLTTAEGEQQKGADYRDPKEVDYNGEYDAMVARVKRLAGLGPMKTVYDPKRRVYRNMPTAQQPKK